MCVRSQNDRKVRVIKFVRNKSRLNKCLKNKNKMIIYQWFFIFIFYFGQHSSLTLIFVLIDFSNIENFVGLLLCIHQSCIIDDVNRDFIKCYRANIWIE